MTSTARKWLIGCGVGCGLTLIIIAGVGTIGYLSIRRVMDRAEDLETGFEDINEAYGDPAEFTPAPDGRIAPERIETFLAIRQEMAPIRSRVAEIFSALDGTAGANLVEKIRAGLHFVPAILEFIAARNGALMDAGMGVGEYQYMYCLAYYVMLDKDPADGPGFSIDQEDEKDGGSGIRVRRFDEPENEETVRYRRGRDLRRAINEVQRQVLANQLAAWEGLEEGAAADDLWGRQLAAEVRALKADDQRLPWQDGLPEPLRISLKPYRVALEEAYDAMTGVLEMGLVDESR